MALAVVLGVGMMGYGVYDIAMEYGRGQGVASIRNQQESIKVRLDAIAKEIASVKPSDDRSHLESLRARLDAIKNENDALKRDASRK
jgi:hypothetical protein